MGGSRGVSPDLTTRVDLPFEEAVERAKSALRERGFGVLTEIRVDRTLKEKIGVDFRPYIILGACNPNLAHQALQQDIEIGLRLPCNVIVYKDDGESVVAVMDPFVAMQGVAVADLESLARQAREKLVDAVRSISG